MRALILNKEHYVLVSEQNPEEPLLSSNERLHGFQTNLLELGIVLSLPIGVRPPDYAFVTQTDATPPGYAWKRLRSFAKIQNDAYWQLYTQFLLGGYAPPTRDIDVFSFGNTPLMASQLLHLATCGKKRATSGNLEALKTTGTTVPESGLVSIVTDGFGMPGCAIQTERVDFARFKDVPEAVAIAEGEGDMTLADWREGHWRFFTEEAKRLGIGFSDETQILTEWFRVLKIF